MISQILNWILQAWSAMGANSRFMAWNLFLALLPLALSFWLFYKPRSAWLRWSVNVLLGMTFILGIQRYNFGSAVRMLRDVHSSYFGLNTMYLLGAIVLTLGLMAIDMWVLRWRGSRSLLWWLGFLSFVLFLPNAPYVLTDIIHLVEAIRKGYSIWIITLALIPQYLLFMGLGFQAYVLSLISLGDYLQSNRLARWVVPAEIVLHGLTAIGIYLGRFERFNSWHILTQPDDLVISAIEQLTGKRPVFIMLVTFVIITILYWLMKQVTLGIIERYRSTRYPQTSHPDSSTLQL